MQQFEYKTTYIPIRYQVNREGVLFKRELPDTTPLPESIDGYHEQLQAMGVSGWELVSVQQLLRGVYDIPQSIQAGGGAISYSLTAGYHLFWKRAK